MNEVRRDVSNVRPFAFQYEYALRHLYVLLNLCERGYTADRWSLVMFNGIPIAEQLLMCSGLFPSNQKLITRFFSLCSIQTAIDSVCLSHNWKDFSASDHVGLPEKIQLLYATLWIIVKWTTLWSNTNTCKLSDFLTCFFLFLLVCFQWIALLLRSLQMIFYCVISFVFFLKKDETQTVHCLIYGMEVLASVNVWHMWHTIDYCQF